MPLAYNPIVRTFCRVREVLVNVLGVDRRQVRPATPLAALVPPERLGEVLARLRAAGLRAQELERPVVDFPLCFLAVVVGAVTIVLPVALGSWLFALIAVPTGFLTCWLAFLGRRTRVVPVPLGPRTVGEMTIALTRFSDHPGHRFTRNEISFKVRLILAYGLGIPLDRVREDSKFSNIEAW